MIYIHFDGTGVGHFSRCEQIAYKQKLDAGEINVSDIRLEQLIEEIYAKQRGKIDDMKEYNQEKIDECINKIGFNISNHILDLKSNNVIVDDNFVKNIIQKKVLELNNLIDKKKHHINQYQKHWIRILANKKIKNQIHYIHKYMLLIMVHQMKILTEQYLIVSITHLKPISPLIKIYQQIIATHILPS